MILIKKLLTITIPAYNVEKYLVRCLNSIVKCSKYLDMIEVLIVDDGSIDNTKNIAEKYVEKYPKTFYLFSKENGGHGSTINYGISHASGLYFLVLDGDDWLDTSALEKLIDYIQKIQQKNIDLISYHYKKVDMITGRSETICQNKVEYQKIYQFDQLPIKDIYFALASTCYKTDILKQMNLKLQEHTYYVDVEYILLPMPHIRNIIFLDIYLYKYFVGNTVQSIYIPNMVKRYPDHNRVMHRIIDELEMKNLTEKHKEYIYSIIEKLLYTHYAISLIYNSDEIQGIKWAEDFDCYLKNTSKELYKRTNNSIHFIKIYRRYNFSIKKIKNARCYKLYIKLNQKCKNIIEKIWRILEYV